MRGVRMICLIAMAGPLTLVGRTRLLLLLRRRL
jgi:hypothetical protein